MKRQLCICSLHLKTLYCSSPLQVNKDFGSIFTTLLPGATAKLAPIQGSSVLEGLELKVALGATWKENLTELSGGQRSAGAPRTVTRVILIYACS